MKRSMSSLAFVLRISLLVAVQSARPANADMEAVCWEDLPEHLARESVPLLEVNVCDCPEDILQLEPSSVIAQIIENTFYLWQEYDVVTVDGSLARCVLMKKPEPSFLSAQKAQVLLTASSRWDSVAPPWEDAEVVDSTDLWLDPVIAEIGREETGRECFVMTIVGNDDRQRITETTCLPWNTHCYLRLDFPAAPVSLGPGWRATGCLVSPHMVLTCGHVVYDQRNDAWAERAIIAPGQTQNDLGDPVVRPYGTREATEFRSNDEFIGGERGGHDYAAILFDEPFGGFTTFLPLEFCETAVSVDDRIGLAGYPVQIHLGTDSEESQSLALWEVSGPVYYVSSHRLYHNMDSSGGNSGSPVRRETASPDFGPIIAIHSASTVFGNVATRLAPHNLTMIIEWMQWTPLESPCDDRPTVSAR